MSENNIVLKLEPKVLHVNQITDLGPVVSFEQCIESF